jgi:hypothetical protein
MKKVYFLTLTVVMLFATKSNAQLSVSINLGGQPSHHNDYYYENNVDYYFLPEIQAYFDNRTGAYVYFNSGGWVRSRYLPDYCRNYDVNRGPRIAIEYRGNSPYDHFYRHKQRYCHNDNRRDYDDNRECYKGKKKYHKNKHDRHHHDG